MKKHAKGMQIVRQLFSSYWQWHALCAVGALVCLALILMAGHLPRFMIQGDDTRLGMLLLSFMLASLLVEVITLLVRMLKLDNKGAALRFATWGGIWVLVAGGFVLMSHYADLSSSQITKTGAPPEELVEHSSDEALLGISALVLTSPSIDGQHQKIEASPNLVTLEKNHPDILQEFIKISPRWQDRSQPDFFARPGYFSLIVTHEGKPMGIVHAAFSRMTEGQPVPKGFMQVKPGAAFPVKDASASSESKAHMPDLALELGGEYFLLLAWRGEADAKLAQAALNTAIATIDTQFEPLAKQPNAEGIKQMQGEKRNYAGQEPQLRLSNTYPNYGTYQAEVYANPQEAGWLTLRIKDATTGKVLRVMSMPAEYSDDANELFRFEIPYSLPSWMLSDSATISKSPASGQQVFFTIKEGKVGESFVAEFELSFLPQNPEHPRRQLLKKRYRVQASDFDLDREIESILPQAPENKEPAQSAQPQSPADARAEILAQLSKPQSPLRRYMVQLTYEGNKSMKRMVQEGKGRDLVAGLAEEIALLDKSPAHMLPAEYTAYLKEALPLRKLKVEALSKAAEAKDSEAMRKAFADINQLNQQMRKKHPLGAALLEKPAAYMDATLQALGLGEQLEAFTKKQQESPPQSIEQRVLERFEYIEQLLRQSSDEIE